MCGDEGVGKTSIIEALISRSFTEADGELSLAGNPSANGQWSEVSLPAELNKYDGIEIDLRIIDTRTEAAVIEHLPSVDAVILVYDITNEDTFERAVSFWLELIQRHTGSTVASTISSLSAPSTSTMSLPITPANDRGNHNVSTTASTPRIPKTSKQIPVILVGNKLDQRGGGRMALSEEHTRKTNAVMGVPCVEAFLYCSAARLLLIREVFYYAQKAVVYPVAPLYDNSGAMLTEQFKVALWRIFRIFDVDRDGYLSDDELALFQSHCFGAQMRRSDISAIKKVVQKQSTENRMYEQQNVSNNTITNDRTENHGTFSLTSSVKSMMDSVSKLHNSGLDGVIGGKVTFAGFVCLNQIFIDRNRPESPWLVLRRFGYECTDNDKLSMRLDRGLQSREKRIDNNSIDGHTPMEQEMYDPRETKVPSLGHVLDDQAFELSSSALKFLNELFTQFAVSKTSTTSTTSSVLVLGIEELRLIFHICPNGRSPWEIFNIGLHSIPTSLERNGWLAMWSLVVHFDPHQLMRYMWYLGYLGDSIKPGESVREMHLHWPFNRLHVERAIRVTQPRSREKWGHRLSRNIVRCWVIGHEQSGKEHLFKLVPQIRTDGAKSTGSSASTTSTTNSNNSSNNRQSSERHAVDGYTSIEGGSTTAAVGNGGNSGSNASGISGGNTMSLSEGLTKDSTSTDLTAVLWYPEQQVAATADEHTKTSGTGVGIKARAKATDTQWVRSMDRALLLTTFVQNLDDCDIAVLVYDPANLNTLDFLKIQQSKLPGHIPCRYVAVERGHTPATGGVVSSAYDPSTLKVQKANVHAAAKEWCLSLELDPPTKLSVAKPHKSNSSQNFFEQVMANGLEPTSCRPVSPERTWEDQKRRAWLYSSIGLGIALFFSAGFFLYKRHHSSVENTTSNNAVTITSSTKK